MLVSALVNGHHEGRLLWHALKSIHAAANVANSNPAGVEVEIVLVLDRPDDTTLEVARELRDSITRTVVADVGDLGLARNIGIDAAAGDVLAILDADDFWGSAWIKEGLLHLARRGPNSILHPQISQYFGTEVSVWHSPCMSDPGFRVATLFGNNVWTSAAMAPIETFRSIRYRARPPGGHFGYEDWSWNCDTIAAGYSHYIVPQTIHFIRRTGSSLSRQMLRSNCLPIPHNLTIQHALEIDQRRSMKVDGENDSC
jgi:glycosyltransferase involved in cell wall biosynthesis